MIHAERCEHVHVAVILSLKTMSGMLTQLGIVVPHVAGQTVGHFLLPILRPAVYECSDVFLEYTLESVGVDVTGHTCKMTSTC